MKFVTILIMLLVLVLIVGESSAIGHRSGASIITPNQPQTEIRGAGAIIPVVIIDDSCEIDNRNVRFRNV